MSYERLTMREWADRHNVHASLLPFSHQNYDPIHLLQQFAAHIEDKAITGKTIPAPIFQEELAEADSRTHPDREFVRLWFNLFGSWEINTHVDKSRRFFMNPSYVWADRENSITNTTRRIDHLKRATKMGVVTSKQIATAWGVSKRTVWRFGVKHDIDVRQRMQDNRHRFYRTMATAKKWTDYRWSDLADAMPVSKQSIKTGVWRNVDRDTLPERPIDGDYKHNFHV